MNLLKRFSSLILMLVILASFAFKTNAQTSQEWSGTNKYNNDNVVSYNFTIDFVDDSLAMFKLPLALVGPYAENLIAVTIKPTGTTPKYFARFYNVNINSNDTAYWNLKSVFDTAGTYLLKPVTDTADAKLNGLTHRFLGVLIGGLSGNRENVKLFCTITAFRKP